MENIVAFLFISAACWKGYRLKLLTASGALAAVVVGMAVFLGFNLSGLVILGIFFVTSSYWSKYKSSKKKDLEARLAKGSTRDWRQVFANGGTAAAFAVIQYYSPDPMWQAAFATAIACANSDTWASEIGTLSRQQPINIRTFKRVPRGTSGAVSSLGTLAALAGALIIAAVSLALFHLTFLYGFAILAFGFAGNLIDTVFGASIQQSFVCKVCGMETERTIHCHQPTTRLKGYSLFDNDMVNFLSGLLSVVIMLSFIQLIL